MSETNLSSDHVAAESGIFVEEGPQINSSWDDDPGARELPFGASRQVFDQMQANTDIRALGADERRVGPARPYEFGDMVADAASLAVAVGVAVYVARKAYKVIR